jgi:hypothetical protein
LEDGRQGAEKTRRPEEENKERVAEDEGSRIRGVK